MTLKHFEELVRDHEYDLGFWVRIAIENDCSETLTQLVENDDQVIGSLIEKDLDSGWKSVAILLKGIKNIEAPYFWLDGYGHLVNVDMDVLVSDIRDELEFDDEDDKD